MDTLEKKQEKLARLIAHRDLLFFRQRRRLDKNLAVNLRGLEIACYDMEMQMRWSQKKYTLLKETPTAQRSVKIEKINQILEREFSRSIQEIDKLKQENSNVLELLEPNDELTRKYEFVVLETHPYFSREKEQEYARAFSALLAGEWSKIYQMVDRLLRKSEWDKSQKKAFKNDDIYGKWTKKLEEEIHMLNQKFPLSSSVYIENEKWVSKRQKQLRSIFFGFKREKKKYNQKIEKML